MKAWVTKYALSLGIAEVEGQTCERSGAPGMLEYGPHQYAHGEGREWHRTRESAIKRAEQMRAAKIASLRKSIAKMEALRFS
jgi:hypothetical protein